jgi:hypothetical protein
MSGDWAVLHLDGDPAPGDPGRVRTLATRLLTDADLAERNTQRLRSISTGDGELRMDGDYAPKFRQALGELPGELTKLSHAYRDCGQALSAFAGSLEQAQGQAAAALRQGRDADGSYQGALRQVQSLLPPERHAAVPGLNPSTLDAGTADLDPGLRAEIQAAAARGRAAEADRDRARGLAQEAAQLRGDAESRCARTIRSALAGIKNKEWYEKAWNFVSTPFRSWDDFVTLCRNVALIAGTVALFVSGPIGLALVAIALIAGAVVFATTLHRYQHGQAGLADVGQGLRHRARAGHPRRPWCSRVRAQHPRWFRTAGAGPARTSVDRAVRQGAGHHGERRDDHLPRDPPPSPLLVGRRRRSGGSGRELRAGNVPAVQEENGPAIVSTWKNYDAQQLHALTTGTPSFLQKPRERECPACGATDVRSYLYRSDRNGQPILIGYSWSTNCHRYTGSTGPLPDGLTFDDPMDDLPPEERKRLRNDLDELVDYLDDQWDRGALPQRFSF